MKSTLSYCNPTNLYYDTKSSSPTPESNWSKVRACAFAKNDNSVLMMLYANGFGVQRNFDIALRHACMVSGAFFEVEGRVNHLTAMIDGRNNGSYAEEFDLCDDITSGYMQGYCAAIGARQNEKVTDSQFIEYVAKLAPRQKPVFDVLQKSLSVFALAHSSHEINLNGTGSAAESIAAEADEVDQFLKDISQFETGELPKFTKNQFSDFDRELNQKFLKLMQTESNGFANTGISKDGIRATQRAWLKYRDAWVYFGRIRYRSVDSLSWKAFYTERRIEQLKALVETTIDAYAPQQ